MNISVPVRLPTPVVLQATPPEAQDGILDLATFTGDANITVESWWFALPGHFVCLKATGIKKDGSDYTFYVLKGRKLTQEEVSNGLVEVMSRAELALLKHDSRLKITCVTASDDSEYGSGAITFPVLNLTLKQPLACEQETFEEQPLGVYSAGGTLQTALMKIDFQSGSGNAGIALYHNNAFASGKHYAMCHGVGHQIPAQIHRFTFTHVLESVRFSCTSLQRPATFTFYDPLGKVIEVLDVDGARPGGFWVDCQAPAGSSIGAMKFEVQDWAFIDNVTTCYRL